MDFEGTRMIRATVDKHFFSEKHTKKNKLMQKTRNLHSNTPTGVGEPFVGTSYGSVMSSGGTGHRFSFSDFLDVFSQIASSDPQL